MDIGELSIDRDGVPGSTVQASSGPGRSGKAVGLIEEKTTRSVTGSLVEINGDSCNDCVELTKSTRVRKMW